MIKITTDPGFYFSLILDWTCARRPCLHFLFYVEVHFRWCVNVLTSTNTSVQLSVVIFIVLHLNYYYYFVVANVDHRETSGWFLWGIDLIRGIWIFLYLCLRQKKKKLIKSARRWLQLLSWGKFLFSQWIQTQIYYSTIKAEILKKKSDMKQTASSKMSDYSFLNELGDISGDPGTVTENSTNQMWAWKRELSAGRTQFWMFLVHSKITGKRCRAELFHQEKMLKRDFHFIVQILSLLLVFPQGDQ